MTEDEAAELLLSQHAHCYYSGGWKILVTGPDPLSVAFSPHGNTYRDATEEETAVLEKVKDIIGGRGSETDYTYSVPPEIRDE